MKGRDCILVTGGAGYIGSHTLLEILKDGRYDAISVDNFSNSDRGTFQRIREISGIEVVNFEVDLTRPEAVEEVFSRYPSIKAVIHFAALKSVPESVEKPDLYMRNNVGSLEVLLDAMHRHGVRDLIFSSSCSVYGNSPTQPVDEDTPLQKAESPYGESKQRCEALLNSWAVSHPGMRIVSLRYFNPVGAHPSGKIGEIQSRFLTNLVPILCAVAAGVKKELWVHGQDYPTRDGTCVRDYIHVCDVAKAHLLAMDWLRTKAAPGKNHVFNLGSGRGTTVLEAIHAFEKVNDLKLNYTPGPRRAGDVAEIYSKADKASGELGWTMEYSLEEMMRTAWNWEKKFRAQS